MPRKSNKVASEVVTTCPCAEIPSPFRREAKLLLQAIRGASPPWGIAGRQLPQTKLPSGLTPGVDIGYKDFSMTDYSFTDGWTWEDEQAYSDAIDGFNDAIEQKDPASTSYYYWTGWKFGKEAKASRNSHPRCGDKVSDQGYEF